MQHGTANPMGVKTMNSVKKKHWSLLMIVLAAVLLEPLWSQGNRVPDVIRVMVTHHGIRIEPPRVKAGPARILLDNRTLLNGTSISIGLESDGIASAMKRITLPEKALVRRSWQDAVLPPGRYRIWVEKASELRALLVVEP